MEYLICILRNCNMPVWNSCCCMKGINSQNNTGQSQNQEKFTSFRSLSDGEEKLAVCWSFCCPAVAEKDFECRKMFARSVADCICKKKLPLSGKKQRRERKGKRFKIPWNFFAARPAWTRKCGPLPRACSSLGRLSRAVASDNGSDFSHFP